MRIHPLATLLASALFLAATLTLAGCGKEEAKAARAKKLADLQAELKAHRAKHGTMAPAWLEARNQVIPARQAYLRAKGSPDEESAKAVFDAANAAATQAADEESAWALRKTELEDAIMAAGG
ncbi:MAG: hypothetical protein O2894_04465 [Planctomycetota bacterium]|nr:hypothetical protein [Planctomycetota bacterium]